MGNGCIKTGLSKSEQRESRRAPISVSRVSYLILDRTIVYYAPQEKHGSTPSPSERPALIQPFPNSIVKNSFFITTDCCDFVFCIESVLIIFFHCRSAMSHCQWLSGLWIVEGEDGGMRQIQREEKEKNIISSANLAQTQTKNKVATICVTRIVCTVQHIYFKKLHVWILLTYWKYF